MIGYIAYANAVEEGEKAARQVGHLQAILANRNRKLREWAKRADQYDVAVGTVIKMITDELLEDKA